MTAILPALLALDWGTTSLRAFLLGADGSVLDSRSSAHGIQHLPAEGEAGFEQALAGVSSEWLRQWPDLPLVAGGMVGSAQGWREAPYVPCPADLARLAGQAMRVPRTSGADLVIAPGVLYAPENAAPDVMRGEEIQIVGALATVNLSAQDACVILPGTHSKWVQLEAGRIERFATYLTGEMFAVLRKHSILGRLMTEGNTVLPDVAEAAFQQGLNASESAQGGDLLHQLFAVRTLGLTQRLPHAALADYLSGLLIGHEIRSGLHWMPAETPLLLIGEPALCQRYANALEALSGRKAIQMSNTAPQGLYRFAQAAGVL